MDKLIDSEILEKLFEQKSIRFFLNIYRGVWGEASPHIPQESFAYV